MSGAGDPAAPTEPPVLLQSQWLLCAVAAAGARFVPVPLVDDLIRARARRTALGLTLGAQGRSYPTEWLAPIYSTGSIWSALAGLPLEIVLLPIRRIVKWVRAARGVPQDLMNTWLMGRALYRLLGRGELVGVDRRATVAEAERMRSAFDYAVEDLDLTVLSAALGGVMDQAKDLGGQAIAFARELAGMEEGDHAAPPTDDVVDPLEEALGSADVQAALGAFDARFDAAWMR
ncbi:MAG: hypothetical protein KDA24_15470 [Deltaproteobacteria bacterium]|nr:hypothetical protein [Deltaproteobacteria bacterium]